MWQVITLSLLMLAINSQSQTLSVNQTISAGTNASYDRVRAVDFSDDQTKLLTVYGSVIKIWTQSGNSWNSFNNVTAPEPLEDTRFNNDGSLIVALANNSNNVYYFNNSGGNSYSLAQTLSLAAKPVSVGWAVKSNFTIFGTADGSIRVYTKNNGSWGPYQIIPGVHTGSVAGIGSRKSRFVSCGSGDAVVKVWYYNVTTGVYTLQETDTMGASNCTALHYSSDQRRYAAGYANGAIYVRERNNTYNYTGSQTVNAGSQPIYNLRFSQDASKIVSASADNNLYLFFRDPNGNWNTNSANNYSNTGPYSVDFNGNNWLAVGTVNTTTGNVNIDQVVASNCSNDANSTGSNDTTSTCACNSGYAYIGGYCQQINCNPSYQNNSNGTNSSLTACNCNTGFVWSTNSNSCVRQCSSVANALSENYDDATCYCNSGYTWGGSSCIVYVNCAGLANSPGTNANAGTCNCNATYVYNTTVGGCVLDCSNVANSNGYNTTNTSQCACVGGYTYNDTFWGRGSGTCIRACNVSGWVRGNDYNDPTKCRCYESFAWTGNSTNNGSCVLDCSLVNYSESVLKKDGECKCQKKYRWDKVIYKCTSKTGTSAAVAIACGVAIPLGVLAILALLGLLLYYCLRKSPAPPVVTPVYMQPAPVVTTTTTEVSKVVPTQVVTSTSRLVGPPVVSGPPIRPAGPIYTSTVPGGVVGGTTVSRGTIGGTQMVTSGLGVGGIRGPPLPPPSGFPGRF